MSEERGIGFAADTSAREPRRERILEAARTVLAEAGYERTTTRRIAEAAGVNIATLHYHFGTKEALLSEAVRGALREAEARLQRAIETAPTAVEALESAFHTTWVLVRERRGIFRYDLAVRGFRDENARGEVNAVYEVYRRLFEQIVERHLSEGGRLAPGVSAPQLSRHVVAAVDGTILQHLLTGDDAATQKGLDLVRQHALSLMVAAAEKKEQTSAP